MKINNNNKCNYEIHTYTTCYFVIIKWKYKYFILLYKFIHVHSLLKDYTDFSRMDQIQQRYRYCNTTLVNLYYVIYFKNKDILLLSYIWHNVW